MYAIYRAQEYNHRIEIPPLYMDEIIIPPQVFFYNLKIMSGQVSYCQVIVGNFLHT